ncbi:hypothetical protein BTXL6_11135 [Bacillus thuringiensis]|nr:hypothetical protein BTXL6_28700 [Bacillus thuringiensis]ALL21965.1 hypothetical protein BTXL6_11135 [Bacillus thuringiensis]
MSEAITTCMQIVLKSIQLRFPSNIQVKEIVHFLWSRKEDSQFIWKICIAHLESLMQSHIPESIKRSMFEKLQHIENEIHVYVELFDRWKVEQNRGKMQKKN